MLKRNLICVFLFGIVSFVFGFGTVVFAQTRIAVVDVQKAVAGSDAGKKARATLEKEKKRLNKMGKEDKLPGREQYKVELIKIIEKSK